MGGITPEASRAPYGALFVVHKYPVDLQQIRVYIYYMNKAPPKYPLSLDERRKRREDPPLEDQKREDTIEELERNFKLNSH